MFPINWLITYVSSPPHYTSSPEHRHTVSRSLTQVAQRLRAPKMEALVEAMDARAAARSACGCVVM